MKARINGHELGFEVLGGRGPSLLLLHGLGLNRTIWQAAVDWMPRGYRVILPDIRGHGESPALEETARIESLAEDMLRLMDTLEVEKAVVAGHSMGGYIALAMAFQHIDRLAGLGLIASRATADTPEKREGRLRMIREIKLQGSGVLAESLAPRLSHDGGIQKQARLMIEKTHPNGLIAAQHALADRPDRLSLLPEIHIPTLVVAGLEDQIVPMEEAKEMADLFPNCTYMEIPKAGHMPMLETPQVLGDALGAFVATCFSGQS
jgi:pimeloyl-ACP methyl ester carboxylesterase